jgi:hypothetical protein
MLLLRLMARISSQMILEPGAIGKFNAASRTFDNVSFRGSSF